MNIIQKNRFHFLIWGLMILFIIFAPFIRDKLYITEGRPVKLGSVVLDTTSSIYNSVDRCDLINIKGQDLYNVWGWSFFILDKNQSNFEKYLVLTTNKNTYFFQSTSYVREGLQEVFKDIDIDVHQAGFNTLISKETLQVGKYQIGILYINRENDATYYQETQRTIVRTPNFLRLEPMKK